MIPFFDIHGLVHLEFLYNQTVNKTIFRQILSHAWESIKRRRGSSLWRSKDEYLLHMDNASPHKADIVLDALGQWGWNWLRHLPYSPDLSPCDFFLFPYLKRRLRGRNFGDVGHLLEAIDEQLGYIPSFLWEGCFRQWQARCQKCILFRGHYFEGLKQPPQN